MRTSEGDSLDFLAAVAGRLRSKVDLLVAPGDLRESLAGVVEGAAKAFNARPPSEMPFLHIPFSISGRDHNSECVAAICTAVYLGARILDDTIDGHESSLLPKAPVSQQILCGAAFMSGIPQSIVAGLQLPAQRQTRVLNELARGLGRLGDGQARDTRTFDAIASPDEIIRIAEGKTGGLIEMVVRMAGAVAGWPAHSVELAGRAGVAWGVGRQVALDCQRLTLGDDRTVENRACSYPIAVHYAELSSTARVEFEATYKSFVDGQVSTSLVLDALSATSAIARSRLIAELHLAHAQARIQGLDIDWRIRAQLKDLIDETTARRSGNSHD